MMRTILSTHALTKSYGPAAALDGIDLTVTAGESIAIMGASGSGKTTLLHCLAGIIRPDRGEVDFTGPQGLVRVSALSEAGRSRLRRESFGFVFQQGLLIPELTALENVAVALMLTGTPRPAAEHHAARWLVVMGLRGLETRRIGELSGGQAQRMAIARAQVSGAAVIFADEPTGALDSGTSADVMDVLLDSTVGAGKTLVLVTHDLAVASRCEWMVELRDGRIIADSADTAAPAQYQYARPSVQPPAQAFESACSHRPATSPPPASPQVPFTSGRVR